MILELLILVLVYFSWNYLIKFIKSHFLNKKIVRYFDYIFVFRPVLFFTVWLVICLGMYIGHLAIYNEIPQWLIKFDFKTTLLFVSLSSIMGSIFINENIDKNTFLEKKLVNKISNCSLYLGIFFLFFTNIYNLFLGLILYLFWFFVYSKTDAKNNIIFKSLLTTFVGVNLLLGGFFITISKQNYFLLNPIVGENIFIILFLSSLCYFAISLSVKIQDFNISKLINRRIFTFISIFILILVFLISVFIDEPLLSICALSSIPFYIFALFRNMDKDILRTVKYPIFIFNFFIATIFPFLAIAVIIVFYISKYYFWHRFDIHYPTFLVEND
tara:strand:+ start:255 stop:1241 length:987 start_codon:yes stop_codon:yes gene_type:complete